MNSKKEKVVLDFIKEFSGFGRDVELCFTCGCCYWFAEILRKRFKGEIYYMPIGNHFVTKIDNQLFDIRGKFIPDEKIYRWQYYKRIEPLESKRIVRDCITKTLKF